MDSAGDARNTQEAEKTPGTVELLLKEGIRLIYDSLTLNHADILGNILKVVDFNYDFFLFFLFIISSINFASSSRGSDLHGKLRHEKHHSSGFKLLPRLIKPTNSSLYFLLRCFYI
jgi:hypothetical protein